MPVVKPKLKGLPFTAILNEVIDLIKNDAELGLYIRMQRQPENWEHRSAFHKNNGCSTDRLVKTFRSLEKLGLAKGKLLNPGSSRPAMSWTTFGNVQTPSSVGTPKVGVNDPNATPILGERATPKIGAIQSKELKIKERGHPSSFNTKVKSGEFLVPDWWPESDPALVEKFFALREKKDKPNEREALLSQIEALEPEPLKIRNLAISLAYGDGRTSIFRRFIDQAREELTKSSWDDRHAAMAEMQRDHNRRQRELAATQSPEVDTAAGIEAFRKIGAMRLRP